MQRGPDASYKAKLSAVREADRKNDEEMTAIAARGGLTLEEMRKLPKREKDAFIFQHRNP